MLRGAKVGLRAREHADVTVLHTELYEDIDTRTRADTRPWRPIAADSAASPFRVTEPADGFDLFSVVELAGNELAGDAVLWNVDLHNRSAHLGLALRPAFRGRGLGTDVVKVLCQYGCGRFAKQRRCALDAVVGGVPKSRLTVRHRDLFVGHWLISGSAADRHIHRLLRVGEANRGEQDCCYREG
jgi:GNAT superfamily N-acetyltransferase